MDYLTAAYTAKVHASFNRPELLAIWAEMKAACYAREIAKGRVAKAECAALYKAAGARYRATKSALDF